MTDKKITYREYCSKVKIKFSNLKKKFTLRDILITLVCLVFAYLLKLSIYYLLALEIDTWDDYLILGIILSIVRPLYDAFIDPFFDIVYCMDGPGSAAASGSGTVASTGLPSESASALAEAEAAGYYNKFHTPESAERAKNSIKQLLTTDENAPFEESYSPTDCLNIHREVAKNIEEKVSKLSKVKAYFEAVEAKREPTPEDKIEYNILKNRYLASFDDKQNWFGRKIDYNNPTNVKERNLKDLNYNKRMLSSFLARLEYLEQLDRSYLVNRGNYSPIVRNLLEVNRKDREANTELSKTIMEAYFKDIDLNTKRD